MARLTAENVQRARDLIALYPQPRSALIPILHIAQEQDGWLTEDAMAHVAELVGITPAEVLGTASFYDMLFTHPVGKHLVSICTNIACLLNGGYELLEHAEKTLGVKAGATTADGQFTLEEVECIADCGRAPCLAVNWRFFGDVSNDAFDTLVSDLRSGRLVNEVPPHGTLNRVKRDITAWAGGAPAAQEAKRRLQEKWAAQDAEDAASAPAEPAAAAAAAPASGGPGQADKATAAESPAAPADKDDRGEAQPASAASTEGAEEHAAKTESPSGADSQDTSEGDAAK